MKMETAWIAEALKYLVPGAAGIFIWVQGIISVMGTMIYAKQPLSDDVLVMLPKDWEVKCNAIDLKRTRICHWFWQYPSFPSQVI